MIRQRIELTALVLAICAGVVFAGLWIHARASSGEKENVVVIELDVARSAQAYVSMPFPIRILDRSGRTFAGIDHHAIAQAVLIPTDRYPVTVEAKPRCRANVVTERVAVVLISLRGRRCFARQIS